MLEQGRAIGPDSVVCELRDVTCRSGDRASPDWLVPGRCAPQPFGWAEGVILMEVPQARRLMEE